jgi:hypothetical protein
VFAWSKSCDIPTGESSTFDQFGDNIGWDTIGGFAAQLQPLNINFAGRILQESAANPVQDTCNSDIPGSAVAVVIPNSNWAIDGSGHYLGDDYIGYTPAAVFYYRLQLFRVAGNQNFSCGFSINQQMKINSCGSSTLFLPYGGPNAGSTNTLSTTITATTVQSQRGNEKSPTRTYP